MSQVTIYLPRDVEARARREAKRRGKSLSAYIASVLSGPERRRKLEKLVGSCPDLRLPGDEDLLPLRDRPLEP
ncbi:MAG: hypothetical protein AB1938_28205 [Myxococcota bacterium]